MFNTTFLKAASKTLKVGGTLFGLVVALAVWSEPQNNISAGLLMAMIFGGPAWGAGWMVGKFAR